MLFSSIAIAEEQISQTQSPAQGIMSFIPLIVIFTIFYLLIIRPQQKKIKEHKKLLSEITANDEVITSGGIYGIVKSTGKGLGTDKDSQIDFVEVDIGFGNIKVVKDHILQVLNKKTAIQDSNKKTDVKTKIAVNNKKKGITKNEK